MYMLALIFIRTRRLAFGRRILMFSLVTQVLVSQQVVTLRAPLVKSFETKRTSCCEMIFSTERGVRSLGAD